MSSVRLIIYDITHLEACLLSSILSVLFVASLYVWALCKYNVSDRNNSLVIKQRIISILFVLAPERRLRSAPLAMWGAVPCALRVAPADDVLDLGVAPLLAKRCSMLAMLTLALVDVGAAPTDGGTDLGVVQQLA